MRYLITGGCGFLGSNIARTLAERRATFAVLDNLSRLGAAQNLTWLQSMSEFSFFHGDVRNRQDVESALQAFRPDCLIHLAGQVAMTTSISRPFFDFQVNLVGTMNILESIREHVPECSVIYSSTNKVYGDLDYLDYISDEKRYIPRDYPEGFDESLGLDFHSPYGCSKGGADQYLLDYSRIFSARTVVLRHSSMYGGRQFPTIDQGWIGWFCQQALRQRRGDRSPFTISGDGKQVRDVLHCDDMVDLYLSLAENMDAVSGQAFNIGGGISNSLSLLELIEKLESKLRTKLAWTHSEPRVSDQKFFVANLQKIKKYTGWQPKVDCDRGLDLMLEWLVSMEQQQVATAKGLV